MKSEHYSWRLSTGIVLILIIAFVSQNYAQENLGRQTILRFSPDHPVLNPSAPKLEETITMEPGKITPLFLSGVGGVSFDKVAQPATGIEVNSLELKYNRSAEDGSRLQLVMNNVSLDVELPDWLLIPVARYADSRYYSCVTIFGKLNDRALERQVLKNKGRIINYHPAFQNTLLGVRLVYMDMLAGYTFTSDLPKNSNNVYILGKGESKPDVNSNQMGAYYLSQHFISASNKTESMFRSYVISDYSRAITFRPENNSLAIDGFPYYYCWIGNGDRKNYNIDSVAKSFTDEHNRHIRQLPDLNSAKQYVIEHLILLAPEYKNNFNFYNGGTFVQMTRLRTDEQKRQLLERYDYQSLLNLLVKTETYMHRDSVIFLEEFSNIASSKPDLFEKANPIVWSATINTMRYAAFFRYVKAHFPLAWSSFISEIKGIDPEPHIVTPTVMYDKSR